MSNILTWFGDGLDLLLGYMDQRNIPVYRESESPCTMKAELIRQVAAWGGGGCAVNIRFTAVT